LGVFPLAKEFGWSIDYILWELPMPLFNQAQGWCAWSNGIRLRRPNRHTGVNSDIAAKMGL